jgi:ABC-2 type transport system ATP-binding protein
MENILVVDGVSKEYPGRFAVKDASFTVKKGSIHGFLGPNGAGKSTTIKMISGLLRPTTGKIELFNEVVETTSFHLKNHIGLLSDNPPLYEDMSVEKYLRFVARLHKVKKIKEAVDSVLENLTLVPVRHRLIGNLSRGYKQRVGLAQAMVYDPPFLILDEPTNGLDPHTVVEFRELIKKLSASKTILFSSHILSEIEQICDEITIIHHGRIRASGNLAEIHRKFHQGLVLKVGLAPGESLPDLAQFGKHEITKHLDSVREETFNVVFDEDTDVRAELSKFLISKNLNLLTLQVDSPELEDIFLHMTETKK